MPFEGRAAKCIKGGEGGEELELGFRDLKGCRNVCS